MKKYFYLLLIIVFIPKKAEAQLPDGTTVPDFTFTDIGGTTHNLYSYLNQGKFVALEVSATWCHPCWLYHTSGSMDSMYNKHDIPGDQTWKVLFIEGDGNTTLADLQGTTGGTQGDWTNGTVFPIMNPAGLSLNDFRTSYDINSFPTLYLICPNHKIYKDTIGASPRGRVATWEYAATLCGPVGFDDIRDTHPLAIYPNPATERVELYFTLNTSSEIHLQVTNILGQAICNKTFGMLSPGDHALQYDVSDVEPGIYFFTVSDDKGRLERKKIMIQ